MDFLLCQREELLRKSVREFAEAEIPPKIETMEKTGEFPLDLLEPMAKLGITGIIAPPEYGGVGLGYLAVDQRDQAGFEFLLAGGREGGGVVDIDNASATTARHSAGVATR